MKWARSFRFALRGISHCIKSERHMRIHLCAAFYVLLLSPFFSLTVDRYIILLLTISSVFSAEMLNTTAEELSDLSTEDYNPMARIAKDVAAGAVLICSVFAVVIGVILFKDRLSWLRLFKYLMHHLTFLLFFIFSLVLSIIFVLVGPSDMVSKLRRQQFKRKKKKELGNHIEK